MRRVIAVLCALACVVALVGCGKAKKDSKDYSGEASGNAKAGQQGIAGPAKAVD